MSEISSVSEALKLLNELVRRGEELEKRATAGPWKFRNAWANMLLAPSPKDWVPTRDRPNYIVCQPGLYVCVPEDEQEANADLIRASRSLVPAMVKGAEAVLKEYNATRIGTPETIHQIEGIAKPARGRMVLVIANSYRPAMVELGWVPK